MPEKEDHYINKNLSNGEDYIAMIYYQYVDDLYSWGNTFTSQKEIIKDCIQDLFAYLLSNPEKLGGINNLRVYLFTSFRNNLLRLLRNHRLRISERDPEEDYYAEIKDPSENIIEKLKTNETFYNRKKEIREILNSLSMRQKRIIFLRYYKQMEYDEICEILSMNYQSARTLIYRLIQRMKSIYRELKLID